MENKSGQPEYYGEMKRKNNCYMTLKFLYWYV